MKKKNKQNWKKSDLIYISEPFDNIIEGLLVGDVVDEHDPHRAAVVRGGDRVETLLPRCVPDLQFYFLTSQFYCLYFEINTW